MKKILESEKAIYYLKKPNVDLARKLQQKFELTPLTASILACRDDGFLDQAGAFFSPSLSNFPDPFLFRDMKKSVSRIYDAIMQNEGILVYGDYDVDGITATAIVTNFFKAFSYPVRYYIPNRFADGYGLNLDRILQLYQKTPFSLLITVDCGISNNDIINTLTRHKIDVIVTDHHQAKRAPSKAFSALNPAIPGCGFPFPHLSGVGVAFFLLIALRRYQRDKGFWNKTRPEPNLGKYLDVVALGTIADMVPLTGVNRILVTYGLKALAHSSNIGLKTFLETLNLANKPLTTQDIAFRIAPRLNAAGRLDTASKGVSLFTTTDKTLALTLSKTLDQLNTRRQKIMKQLLDDVFRKINRNECFISPFAIVLWDASWHEGVMGIVASKIVETYGRPAVLISLKRDMGKGSIRGIAGFNIFQALQTCVSSLVSFGGHPMAGGITIKASQITAFAKNFSSALEKQCQGKPIKAAVYIDALVKNGALTRAFFDELQNLAPFGTGNPSPLLWFCGYRLKAIKLLKGKHIKFFISSGDDFNVQGIAFNAPEWFGKMSRASSFFAVPTRNTWNGHIAPQLVVKKFISKDDL